MHLGGAGRGWGVGCCVHIKVVCVDCGPLKSPVHMHFVFMRKWMHRTADSDSVASHCFPHITRMAEQQPQRQHFVRERFMSIVSGPDFDEMDA